MAEHPRSVLPPEVSAKLASLYERLEAGPSDAALNDVLADLSSLAPNLIVRASGEIAAAAYHGRGKPNKPSLLASLFRKPLSKHELLKKNPDYGWLFLFDYDGFLREAALDAITRPPASPFFVAALAWRLNDWARPVRQAAKRCAERVLPHITTNVAVDSALYLLDRRLAWARWGDEPEVLDAVFSHQEVIAALASQFRERANGPLATCLRHALRYPSIDEHLPQLAADAVQPAVRAIAYRCLISGKASWPVGYEWMWIDKVYGVRKRIPTMNSRGIQSTRLAAEWIREGVRDRSAQVRIVAADALTTVRGQMSDAESLIGQLARDRSAAVRLRGDFMLRHPINSPA